MKEINSQERDKFWKREEEEEKRRLDEEKQRQQEERLKLELERQQREGRFTGFRLLYFTCYSSSVRYKNIIKKFNVNTKQGFFLKNIHAIT